MIPYCFWISLGPPAGGVWVLGCEQRSNNTAVGLKTPGDIINFDILKYQGMGGSIRIQSRHSLFTKLYVKFDIGSIVFISKYEVS